TMSLIANQYGHCNKEMGLGAEVAAAGGAGAFFQLMASKAVDGMLNATLIDDIWKGLQERVGAHAMENYRNLVAELFKKSWRRAGRAGGARPTTEVPLGERDLQPSARA